MKSVKLLTVIIVLICMFSTTVQSQTTTTKKSVYPVWSLSPVGGIGFPIGTFGDNYESGGTFGLDVSYRVNREVGFYTKFGYYFFPNKTTGIPDGKYIEYTAGPRYFFTSSNLKSAFFLEAGLGGYTFMQDAYTASVNGAEVAVPKVSSTDFGVNAGLGAVLNLGKSVDLIFKVKYHNILTTDGSSSFVAPLLGIDIKL